jgi:hypothetical protein
MAGEILSLGGDEICFALVVKAFARLLLLAPMGEVCIGFTATYVVLLLFCPDKFPSRSLEPRLGLRQLLLKGDI